MDYTSLRDSLVRPKIEEYGKVVSLRRPGSTTGWTKAWVPAEGRFSWYTASVPSTVVYVDPAGTPVDVAGHAIEAKYDQVEIDGTTVQSGDRRFKTSDLPTPTTADKLVVGSAMLTIVSVKAVQPGDVALLWELQCRGM